MFYTLSNDNVKITISDLGAEIQSIIKDGTEYLYDGNPKYWKGRAPIMFPICGRLFEGKYIYENKEYLMRPHGLARISIFEFVNRTENSITFVFKSSDETLKSYPFKFEFYVTYTLKGNVLNTEFRVVNADEKEMYFTLGAHPAFKMPIADMGDITDCYVEFDTPAPAKRLHASELGLRTGKDYLFGGEQLKVLPLSHELFDNDSVFLYDTAKALTVKSKLTDKSIRFNFEKFKYIGFWHMPKTDAPFTCVEPWLGSPDKETGITDITQKEDMIRLLPSKSFDIDFDIAFN